jgi:hypothetical protein
MTRLLPLLTAVFTTVSATSILAAELKVLSSNNVRQIIEPMIADFEKSSGHKVTIAWDSAGGVEKRLRTTSSTMSLWWFAPS